MKTKGNKHGGPSQYEPKLKRIMERLGVTEFNWDYGRQSAWVQFVYGDSVYRVEHSVEKAARAGLKLEGNEEVLGQIISLFEDLERMVRRGVGELPQWLQGIASRWMPIPGFPEYHVSVDGLVFSMRRGQPRLLSPHMNTDGYLLVYPCPQGKKLQVHRAVLSAFVRPPLPGEICRHLDGNRINNSVANLAWGTNKDNADDRSRHGTVARGERAGTAKLTEADVIAIRRHYKSRALTQVQLVEQYGVSLTCIRRAATGTKWAHVKEGLCEKD